MKKIFILLGVFISFLSADCSKYIGGITINEAYKKDNLTDNEAYVELKILDDDLKDVNKSNWELNITKNDGTSKVYTDLSSDCDSDDYIKIDLDDANEIDAENGTFFTIKDENGNYIDYLVTNSNKNHTIDKEAEKCDYDYDTNSTDSSSSDSVDFYRDPDGTGDWTMDECDGVLCMAIASADNSECGENNSGDHTVTVNNDDNEDGDEGDGCDDANFTTIKDAVDYIRDNGDGDAYTIKVCDNDENKSAYADVLDLNDSNLDGLTIEDANSSKIFYIELDDKTPIIIDGRKNITLEDFNLTTNQMGIKITGSTKNIAIKDANISSDGCGIFKDDNDYLTDFKLYNSVVNSDNNSSLCLRNLRNSDSKCHKFYGVTLNSPRFGFNMIDDVKGCAVIANANVDADYGGLCTDLNVTLGESKGGRNFFDSKVMGIRVKAENSGVGFAHMDMKVDTSAGLNISDADSCGGDGKAKGYGIYVDDVADDYNWSISDVKISDANKSLFLNGGNWGDLYDFDFNSNYGIDLNDTKFKIHKDDYDFNTMNFKYEGLYANKSDLENFEINDTKIKVNGSDSCDDVSKGDSLNLYKASGSWVLNNVSLFSQCGYAMHIEGGDNPTIMGISADSYNGIYFKDVKNVHIDNNGEKQFNKILSRNGDGFYFAGESDEFDISNLMLRAPNGNGFIFEGSDGNFTFKNNFILGCGKAGLFFKGSGNKAGSDANITSNLIMGCKEEAFKVDDQDDSFTPNVFTNCFFNDDGSDDGSNDWKNFDIADDDVNVTENYLGSWPFGKGKGDNDNCPTYTYEDGLYKCDSNESILAKCPVDFEAVNYKLDECDDNAEPADSSEAKSDDEKVDANETNVTRFDYEKINSSLLFKGDTSSYIDVDKSLSNQLTDEITYSLWFARSDTDDKEQNLYDGGNGNRIFLNSDSKPSFSLNIDGVVKTVTIDKQIDDKDWHSLIACYDGMNMKFYLDGDDSNSIEVSGEIEKNLDSNSSLAISYDKSSNPFAGYIDEPKIFKMSLCGDDNVKRMYEEEKDRRNFYRGEKRALTKCAKSDKKYLFYTKDTDINDKNATVRTKKIGNDFNLTLFLKDDKFDGNTTAVIKNADDENISDIVITDWNGEDEKNVSFTDVNESTMEARVYVHWENNVTNNSGDDNDTNDSFAIIPVNYDFGGVPDTIKAGEKYEINITALRTDGKKAEFYKNDIEWNSANTQKSTITYKGDGSTEDKNISKFDKGVSTTSDFKIDDIGTYTLELNDTEFAKIDEKDTPEENRTIIGSKDIKVIPYKYVVYDVETNASNAKKWLYIADRKDFNYTIKGKVSAQNKEGKALKHFDKDAEAEDVNTTIILDINSSNDEINLTSLNFVNGEDKEDNQSLSKDNHFELNQTISKSDFKEGNSTHYFGFNFNFKRDKYNALNPITSHLKELNVTDKDDAVIEGYSSDENKTFYYGRIIFDEPEIKVTDASDTYNTQGFVYAYVDDDDDVSKYPELDAKKRKYINWYNNKKHEEEDGNISQIIITTELNNSTDYEISSDDMSASATLSDGELKISIDNKKPVEGISYLHFYSEDHKGKWLWYNKYEDYNDTNNTLASQHYMIEYEYRKQKDSSTGVGSGEFKGAEVNTSNKIYRDGVKVYR